MIQKLSTGVHGVLGNGSHADRAADPVLRLEPRPTFLADRQELLAELGARLAGSDDAGPRVAVLYGLGGTGKTSVAVEYAYLHLAEVGMAWQFPAEDPAVLGPNSPSWPPSSAYGKSVIGGIRCRRCMPCWLPTLPSGCWCSIMLRTRNR